MKSLEVLKAELALCIELHEAMNRPWFSEHDMKGDLTARKRKLRKQIREVQSHTDE